MKANAVSTRSLNLPVEPKARSTGTEAAGGMPATKLGNCVALLILIIASACIGILYSRAPAPAAATASATSFSSARALAHLRHIAKQPHPLGTPADTEVRNYIVGQLKALGLAPEIHVGLGLSTSRTQGDAVGTVRNVLVRIPGRMPGKAVLLAAHYDSVPTGPGAADNGASVAAILETLRALKQGEPLDHDVVALFSDGEEPGMLGATAFVNDDPWAKSIGLVLNFDYRGNSGPMVMFETSSDNGALISGFASAAAHPIGSSLVNEVKKLLPNETDMTPFKRAGIPGMNFAAIESPYAYHAEIDRVDNLDQGSLQHEGDLMLALTRHFGNMPLDSLKAPDRVYFDLAGTLVHYPQSWVPALSLTVVALLGAMLWLGVRSRQLRFGRVLLALAGFVPTMALFAVGSQLSWLAIQSMYPAYRLFITHYNGHWYLFALVAFVIGFFSAILARTQHRITAVEVASGAMLCWAGLLMASTVWLPGVTFLLTWPLLSMLAAQAFLFSARGRRLSEDARAYVSLAGAALGIVLFAPLVRSLYIGLGPKTVLVPAVVLVLLLGTVAPILAALTRRWWLPVAPLAAGVLFLIGGSLDAGFDANHPRPSELLYVKDSVSGKAFWLSSGYELDDWNKPYFKAGDKRQVFPPLFGNRPGDWHVGAAPEFPVAAPVIDVLYDRVAGAERQVGVRVHSLRHAPRMTISVDGDVLLGYSVQDHVLPGSPAKDWWINAYAMPDDTIELALKLKTGKPIRIRAADRTYGLASVGVPPRPSAFMSYPFGHGDTVQATGMVELPPSH